MSGGGRGGTGLTPDSKALWSLSGMIFTWWPCTRLHWRACFQFRRPEVGPENFHFQCFESTAAGCGGG